jgi:hypothetical protein
MTIRYFWRSTSGHDSSRTTNTTDASRPQRSAPTWRALKDANSSEKPRVGGYTSRRFRCPGAEDSRSLQAEKRKQGHLYLQGTRAESRSVCISRVGFSGCCRQSSVTATITARFNSRSKKERTYIHAEAGAEYAFASCLFHCQRLNASDRSRGWPHR